MLFFLLPRGSPPSFLQPHSAVYHSYFIATSRMSSLACIFPTSHSLLIAQGNLALPAAAQPLFYSDHKPSFLSYSPLPVCSHTQRTNEQQLSKSPEVSMLQPTQRRLVGLRCGLLLQWGLLKCPWTPHRAWQGLRICKNRSLIILLGSNIPYKASCLELHFPFSSLPGTFILPQHQSSPAIKGANSGSNLTRLF